MRRFGRWFFFNIWYLFGKPPWDTGISPPELVAFIQLHSTGRALDLGCGTGRNVLALAQAGWQVTGVDFAVRAVAAAKRRIRAAHARADIRLGDVTRLEHVRDPFDLILDIGCYHGLPDASRAAYRENLRRLLAPGGTFLLYAHLRDVGIGIDEQEIERLSSILSLSHRQDSYDPSGPRSTWLTLQNA